MSYRLTLEDLKVMDALLSERSLTRAAHVLRVSQPAVSKVLARLRRRFNDPLLVRAARGMEPTRRALSLQRSVREILLATKQLDAPPEEFDPKQSARLFRLFISDVGVIQLLPRVMQVLQSEGSPVLLHAVQIDPERLPAKLEVGDIDLAVGPFPALGQTIRRMRLFTEGYVSVARHDHPRINARPTLAAFCEERHIVVSAYPVSHVHRALERTLTTALPPEHIAIRVPGFVAAAMVAKHTDALATLPSRVGTMLAQEFGLRLVRPPLTLPQLPIGLYWHERSHRDPANKWLRSLFHRLFSDAAGQSTRTRP